MIRFEYPQLKALAAVVEGGSFEQAARLLNLSQPAVSNRIRQLEEGLGAPVILRGGERRLTAVGEVLYRHLAAVGRLESEAAAALAELKPAQRPGGLVRIVVDELAVCGWLSAATIRISRELGMTLQLCRGDAAAMLAAGRADLAIGLTNQAPPGFTAAPLGELRLRAVAAPGFIQAAGGPPVSPAALAGLPSLSLDAGAEALRDWLARHAEGAAPTDCHRMPLFGTYLECLRGGAGWGLLPEHALAGHGEALVDLHPACALPRPVHLLRPAENLRCYRRLGTILRQAASDALAPADVSDTPVVKAA